MNNLDTLTNEQRASIFSGMYQCETNNGYSMSPHDGVKIIKEMSDMVKQLECNPANLGNVAYISNPSNVKKYDLPWVIRTLNKEPGGIMVHPDNVRYIYDMLNQEVPKWFVEKWGHTFERTKI